MLEICLPRIVRPWRGLVSLKTMRFRVSFSAFAFAALALVATVAASGQSSSSNAPAEVAPSQAPATPQYVQVDPLAGVRYDNRFDLSLGAAYQHIKAGPTLREGANLGGLDISGSYWFAKRLGVEGTFRPTVGTSGAAPNTFVNSQGQVESIQGPFVAQYLFAGGIEWLGPHNKHGALIAHALMGGAYGDFEHDLRGQPPSLVDFYNNQFAPAGIFGGHWDLNRSPQWVFRITTDAVWTRYSTDYSTNISPSGGRNNWNYAMSVGMEYKFKKKRK
jgi:hypothetical protein